MSAPRSPFSRATAWTVALLVAVPLYLLSVPPLDFYLRGGDVYQPSPLWYERYSAPFYWLRATPLRDSLDAYYFWCQRQMCHNEAF